MHRASAALRDAASVLGSGQSNVLAQHPQQGGVGIDIDRLGFSVDGERDHLQSCERWPTEGKPLPRRRIPGLPDKF
jgi:hypothetical protein